MDRRGVLMQGMTNSQDETSREAFGHVLAVVLTISGRWGSWEVASTQSWRGSEPARIRLTNR